MDQGTEGDVADRHGVGRSHVDLGAGNHRVAHLEPDGRQDVALFAVGIVQQSDEGGAIGVVLDGRHPRRHVELVAPEVDDAVPPLVAAAAMAGRDVAVAVATG